MAETLIYNPAIITPLGDYVFLPLPIEQWSENPTLRSQRAEVTGADGELLLSQRVGVINFSISGQITGFDGPGASGYYDWDSSISRTAARTIWENLKANLTGLFALQKFEGIPFENCICDSATCDEVQGADGLVLQYQLSIACLKPPQSA